MTDTPIELDKHRGMAAQKATDIRRVIADVEANAKLLRDKQGVVEIEILGAPAASWPEAVAKARYVLNLYSAGLPATDTHHRDLVAAVLADLTRLSGERPEQVHVRPESTAPFIQPSRPGSNGVNRKHLMQNLSPRHVMTEESLRLGVESGWYSTKVSGTFVSGPHSSEADCLRRIAEINPPPVEKRG